MENKPTANIIDLVNLMISEFHGWDAKLISASFKSLTMLAGDLALRFNSSANEMDCTKLITTSEQATAVAAFSLLHDFADSLGIGDRFPVPDSSSRSEVVLKLFSFLADLTRDVLDLHSAALEKA